MRAIHERYAGSVALAGLGAVGAFGATADLRARVAAPPVEVVDTIGAGDTFGAAVLTRLYETDHLTPDLNSDEPTFLLSFACEAAAIACTRVGAESPVRSELSADPKGLDGQDRPIGLEDVLDGGAEESRDLERQGEAGIVLARLDRVDRLARYPE